MSAASLPTRPIGRLAPSPTGRLHLGHARSFLLAWWQARSRGGEVRLRIEDLDRERCRPEYVDGLLADLEWLGLDWDGEPLFQSRDTTAMERACDELVARGLAYPCVCSRAEIAALSAPHAGESEPRYPGTCRGRWPSASAARAATGREPALRVVVPEGSVELRDGFAGDFRADVQRDVGDFLVRRKDGAFAYQLAVVVDDARSGVDVVLRGDDLLPSAVRQWHVQAHLGLAHPAWFHVPLVVDERGERLAKRRGSHSLASLRERGVDARAVVGWVAGASGQGALERIHARDLLGDFDLERVPRGAAVLDQQTLERLSNSRA